MAAIAGDRAGDTSVVNTPTAPVVTVLKKGDVVWARTDSSLPKWPCKVEEILDQSSSQCTVVSFGDHIQYIRNSKALEEFFEKATLFVKKAKRSLKNKKHYWNLFFNKALVEVTEYITAHIDSKFDISFLDTSSPVSCTDDTTPKKYSQLKTTRNNDMELLSDVCKTRKLSHKRSKPSPSSSTSSSASTTPKKINPNYKFMDRNIEDGPITSKRRRTTSLTTETNSNYKSGDKNIEDSSITLKRVCKRYHNTKPIATSSPLFSCTSKKGNTSSLIPHSETTSTSLSPHNEATPISFPSNDNNTNSKDPSPFPSHSTSDSDSDDGLPSVSFSDQDWSVNQIKVNDIVWAKHPNYPFWPSLVHTISVNKKKKKSVYKVFYFGWDDKASIRVPNSKKNIASFTYENIKRLKSEGSKQAHLKGIGKQFDFAVKEAETLQQLRVNNEISGTPDVQYQLISQKRPLSFQHDMNLLQKLHEESCDDNSQLLPSKFFKEEESDEDDSSIHIEEGDNNEERENNSSPYSFTNLQEHFRKILPILDDIRQGKEYSELHQTFTCGLTKEVNAMKTQEKYGPANNLSDDQKWKLYQLLGHSILGEQHFDFKYVYDVLLPEVNIESAMVRTICAVEQCSMAEAWEKMNS